MRITANGFLDELKDKAEEFGDKAKEGFGYAKDKTEEVIENVKDRFDGDDETMGSEESVGYSSEGAEGIKEAVAATADSARSSFEDATAAAQDSADSIGGPPVTTESAHPRSRRLWAPKRLPTTVGPIPSERPSRTKTYFALRSGTSR